MTRLVRNLGKLVALGSMLWLLAGLASPATAEINLNPWFYPKWGAGRATNQANPTDSTSEMSRCHRHRRGTNGQSGKRPARVAMSTSAKQTSYDGTAPASYQSGTTGDGSGNPGYQSSGNRNPTTSAGSSQGRPRMAGQNAGQNQNGYGRIYGLQASRMQVGNSQSVMAPGSTIRLRSWRYFFDGRTRNNEVHASSAPGRRAHPGCWAQWRVHRWRNNWSRPTSLRRRYVRG